MELTNHHRRALVDLLQAAIAKKAELKLTMKSETAKEDLSFAESVEINDFLNDQTIEAIEKALVDNDIDY